MNYKGYASGPITFDDEAGIFHGEVAGLRDVVTFQATNAEDLVTAFRGSIDDYLALCAAEGTPPDRPYNGTIPLRLSPELHRKAATAAAAAGTSLNQWIASRIEAS
jgi:predicted HicB family RNase H-like nuclease